MPRLSSFSYQPTPGDAGRWVFVMTEGAPDLVNNK